MQRILCSKREAADALSCSMRTIENLASTGQLKTRSLGRRKLVVCASLEALANKGTGKISGTGHYKV
jgi:hypothetical protein